MEIFDSSYNLIVTFGFFKHFLYAALYILSHRYIYIYTI